MWAHKKHGHERSSSLDKRDTSRELLSLDKRDTTRELLSRHAHQRSASLHVSLHVSTRLEREALLSTCLSSEHV